VIARPVRLPKFLPRHLPATRGGRALLATWVLLLGAGAVLAGVLQWLGPPPGRLAPLHRPVAQRRLPPRARPAAHAAPPLAPGAALLEPAPDYPGYFLPRIAADGRRPDSTYAAPVPVVPAGHPRIALLLEGAGLSATASLAAIASLPPAVSLAVSPYAASPAPIVRAARRAGHEVLLSLPMAPLDAPLDDEGAQALGPALPSAENARRLEWSLSRFGAYAGVTNALSGMDGGQFTGTESFAPVLASLARRGLFYVDATPGQPAPSGIASADASLRLDDPPSAAGMARALDALEQMARRRGQAIGIAGPLYPATIQALGDWIPRAAADGFVLVPVSSLVSPPLRRPAVAGGGAAGAEGAPTAASRP